MAKRMVCQVSSNLRRAVCGRVGIIGVRSSVDSVCGWVGFGCVQVMTTLTTFMCGLVLGCLQVLTTFVGCTPPHQDSEKPKHVVTRGWAKEESCLHTGCARIVRAVCATKHDQALPASYKTACWQTLKKTHAHSAHPTLGMNAMIKATGGHH